MRRLLLTGFLALVFGLSYYFGMSDDGALAQEDPVQAEGGKASKYSAVVVPKARDGSVVQLAKREVKDDVAMLIQNGKLIREDELVKEVLSSVWVDGEEKAVRRRIRVAEAKFKYSRLRIEEEVRLNQKTGKPEVKITQASVADHLMVGLKDGVTTQEATEILEGQGFSIRKSNSDSYLLVEVEDFADAGAQQDLIEELGDLGGVVDFAEPDYLVYACAVPNDPAFSEGRMWGMDNDGSRVDYVNDADIDSPEGWEIRTGASSQVVAVLDTGIRYTHEDLIDNMWVGTGAAQLGRDFYDDDYDPMDEDGHGTHCAGTIGARGNNGVGTAGVAWDVKLMAVRFLGENGGATSDAVSAVNFARSNGASIINASWGGAGRSQALENAIKSCYMENILFVAAAGNDGKSSDMMPHYPSSFETPNIVSVASTEANDRLSGFSNFGRINVDLAAPGGGIWSCGIGADNDYRFSSGTSMAAPHVAGALALVRAQFDGETAEEAIARLSSSVDLLPSLENKVKTGGRLNLHRLLTVSEKATPHDDFNAAWQFGLCYGYWCGLNTHGTREADENSFSPNTGQKSLWFTWVAPEDGMMTFEGRAAIDLSVAIFEGEDRNHLRRVADNFSQRVTTRSLFNLYVKRGERYYFSVDSRSMSDQLMFAILSFRPKNDFLADAVELTDPIFSIKGNNCSATQESFEKNLEHSDYGQGRTVWWEWTPNFDGEYVMTTAGSSFDTVMAVYSGAPNSLSPVAFDDDANVFDYTSQVKFTVTSGTKYYVVVDSYKENSSGEVCLSGFPSGQLSVIDSPEDTIAELGEWIDFSVTALDERPLSYIWKKNGLNLSYPTDRDTLYLRPVRAGSYGSYSVEITDGDTSVTRSWELKAPEVKPFFTREIEDRIVSQGGTLTLTPELVGSEPLSYQWLKDGEPLFGETMRELSISPVQNSGGGIYTLRASNAYGESLMNDVVITVQGEGALEWVQRLPAKHDLHYRSGVIWEGEMHFITHDAQHLHGKHIDNLRGQPLPGFVSPFGMTTHSSDLVVFGSEGSNLLTSDLNKLMVLEPGGEWEKISTNWGSGNRAYDLVSNGTKAVATIGGVIMYSSDLEHWTAASGLIRSDYRALSYNGSVFVAIRSTREGSQPEKAQWAVSTDGMTWVEHSDGVPAWGSGGEHITTANGLFFVYGGYPDRVSVSADGVNWSHNHPHFADGAEVVYDGNFYYHSAGGRSTDGYTWEEPDYSAEFWPGSVLIIYEGDFVRCGSSYERIYTQGFIEQSDEFFTGARRLEDGIVAGGSFEDLGKILSLRDFQAISVDGITWTKGNFFEGTKHKLIETQSRAYSGTNFWTIGRYANNQGLFGVYVGPYEGAMKERALPPETHGNTDFTGLVATGDHGVAADSTRLWISHDSAASWELSSVIAGVANKNHIVATPSGFVCANGSTLWVSTDGGSTWVAKGNVFPTVGGESDVVKMVSDQDNLLVLDGAGYLHRSSDQGVTWSRSDLGETGWVSTAMNKGNIYVLHVDGRLGVSDDGVNFVYDSQLGDYGNVQDLVAFDGAMFVSAGSRILQAGEVELSDVQIQTTGISEQGIYDVGDVLDLKWNASASGLGLTGVTILLDGEIIHTDVNLSGGYSLVISGDGRHVVEVIAEGSNGSTLLDRRIFHARGVSMNMVVSKGGEKIVSSCLFAGALYVATSDGRVMRSGDGESWDLALQLPAAPDLLLSDGRTLLVAGKQAFFTTRDGIEWESRGTNGMWLRADELGFNLGEMTGRVESDYFIVTSGGAGTIYSSDGRHWTETPLKHSFRFDMEIAGNAWIQRENDGPSDKWYITVNNSVPVELSKVVQAIPTAVVAHQGMFLVGTANGIKTSIDGVHWEDVSSAPADISLLTEVSGIFFARTGPDPRYNSGAINQFYMSVDGEAWSEVDRIPEFIHDGVWWQNREKSNDGITWIDGISGSADYETTGFVGGNHIVRWVTNPNSSARKQHLGVVEEDGSVREISLLTRYLTGSPWSSTSDIPRKSFFADDGTLHVFGANYYASRSSSGIWSALQATSRTAKVYHEGIFYDYSSSLSGKFLHRSANGRDWETVSLGVNVSDNGYAAGLESIGGSLYYLTSNNVYQSADGGDSWDVVYQKSLSGYQAPQSIVLFNGKVLVLGSGSGLQPLERIGSTNAWEPVSNGVMVSSNSKKKLNVLGEYLFLIENDRSYRTDDMVIWEQENIPVSEYGGSLSEFYIGQGQMAITYRNIARYETFVTDSEGNWKEFQEIEPFKLPTDFVGGSSDRVIHHRGQQVWIESGRDLEVAITSVSSSQVALDVPVNIDYLLRNRQSDSFEVADGGVVRFWMVRDGVYDYQERVLLKTVSLNGVLITGDTDLAISEVVQFPATLAPGDYSIVAELADDSGEATSFDEVARNNMAIFEERLTLEGRFLDVSALGNGSVGRDDHRLIYANGARVSLAANVGKGAVFSGWEGDAYGAQSQITIVMDSDKSVQASFTEVFNMQVLVEGRGAVSGVSDDGNYAVGSIVPLNAHPVDGWRFDGWEGAASGATSSVNVTMDSPKAVVARFVQDLEAWRSDVFSAAELTDGTISGDMADPDGDGLENWKEYLHGSDPNDARKRGVLKSRVEGGYLYVIFERNIGANGGYSLACSGGRDLLGWEAPDLQERVLYTVEGVETVEARMPVSGGSSGFIRMNYVKP